MTQDLRANTLIEYLLDERGMAHSIPTDTLSKKRLLRALLNTRMPSNASKEFLNLQGEYLQEELRLKGVTDAEDLQPLLPDIYLWKGDITTLRCDGIVNAANSGLLGCFCPNHGCIDNAIHTFAGVELRLECAEIMKKQGREEKTGEVKVTKAYNLPSKYVLHTVGPIVCGGLTQRHKDELANCYLSCLKAADEMKMKSIAFCCISTGEFMFPNDCAAKIAVDSVMKYKERTHSGIKVIFNVFKENDYDIYKGLLSK